MTALDALTRTVLLIRDFITEDEASDDTVVAALTCARVAIVADEETAKLSAAQAAITSLAAQVLASGAQLELVIPNVRVAGYQPPLRGPLLRDALLEYAADLIPGGGGSALGAPSSDAVVFLVGNTPATAMFVRSAWRLGWTSWSAMLRTQSDAVQALDTDLPVGALAAANLAAAEAFKFVMRDLLAAARIERIYDELGATLPADVVLAPEDTEPTMDFGRIDMISGGAIANAFLHGLLRIPQARASVRVFEPERLDLSNLNRYALARRSTVREHKTAMLESWQTEAVAISGEQIRFDKDTPDAMQVLAPIVLMGTDDIPSRWFVQALQPTWLCVGATIHFTAMVSEHDGNSACAGCVHPEDDDVNAPVATAAFVSYWAGLLLLVRLLRKHSNRALHDAERVLEVATLQPGAKRGVWLHPASRNSRCPLHCSRAA